MKVSIIVPVYNTAPFLSECFDSILSQSFQDFEVIIVDDGSTDGSAEICDEYCNKDKRFVVIHKINEGVTKARNVALELSKGDFVAFIDSDDTIESTMLEEMVYEIQRLSLDVIKSSDFRGTLETQKDTVVYTGLEALRSLLGFEKIHASLCLGLFRKSLFNDVSFPQEIQFWEDYTITALLLSKSARVAVIPKKYYNYRDRQGSATRVVINDKTVSCLKIADYLNELGVFVDVCEYYNVKSYFIRFCYFLLVNDLTKQEYKNKIKGEIINNIMIILKASIIPVKTKILMIVYAFFPDLALKVTKMLLK